MFFSWQTGAWSLEWWFTSSDAVVYSCCCCCCCTSTLCEAAYSLPPAPAAPHPPPLPQPAPLPHCRSSLSPHQRSVAPFPLPSSLLPPFPSSGTLVFLVHFLCSLLVPLRNVHILIMYMCIFPRPPWQRIHNPLYSRWRSLVVLSSAEAFFKISLARKWMYSPTFCLQSLSEQWFFFCTPPGFG